MLNRFLKVSLFYLLIFAIAIIIIIIIIIEFDCQSITPRNFQIHLIDMLPLKTHCMFYYFSFYWKTVGNKSMVNYCSWVSSTKIHVFLSQTDKFHIITTTETCNACIAPVANSCSSTALARCLILLLEKTKRPVQPDRRFTTACHKCQSEKGEKGGTVPSLWLGGRTC